MEYTIVRFKIDAVPMKARKYRVMDTSIGTCELCVASGNAVLCHALPACDTHSYFKKVRVR